MMTKEVEEWNGQMKEQIATSKTIIPITIYKILFLVLLRLGVEKFIVL